MEGTAAPDAEKVVVHDSVHVIERVVSTPRPVTETAGRDGHEEPRR